MTENDNKQEQFSTEVSKREKRRMRTRNSGRDGMWYGLGMFGIIGWSVAIPTMVAVFIGIWIDYHFPTQYSWTLMLLFIGLLVGCLNAWYWIQKERETITREREDNGGA
ncbi:AtpZ/AtpI family protein [Desulfogranum japonicum]|uniref:AtpZ/AtpI family protein n=1 Tax=Desulfogranum japonicum TaxID=231447 RepID=UPI0004906AAC|nr:AtpZ/AtpI family protein [Desulfogranum japonicum]